MKETRSRTKKGDFDVFSVFHAFHLDPNADFFLSLFFSTSHHLSFNQFHNQSLNAVSSFHGAFYLELLVIPSVSISIPSLFFFQLVLLLISSQTVVLGLIVRSFLSLTFGSILSAFLTAQKSSLSNRHPSN